MTETEHSSRAEATRARLLDAAVTAFAERGYHGTTTRDIAAAAGMSPAAVYVHHSSKEELLYLISKKGHEELLQVLREAVATSDDPARQLRATMRAFTVHHVRTHTSARVVNYELAALSEQHLAEMQEIRHEIDQLVTDLVDRGIAADNAALAGVHDDVGLSGHVRPAPGLGPPADHAGVKVPGGLDIARQQFIPEEGRGFGHGSLHLPAPAKRQHRTGEAGGNRQERQNILAV